MITNYELEKINRDRKAKGLPPLTKSDARTAIMERRNTSRDESLDFLIGYTTGVPMPSASGILGAMMHSPHSHSINPPSENSTPDSGGGSFGGGGASGSWSESTPSTSSQSDSYSSGASSSSSGSSSSYSSSYDSGSSSSSSDSSSSSGGGE